MGDATFVAARVDDAAQGVVSKRNTVSRKLRDLHLQSLYAVTLHALAPSFFYWTQHAYPDDVRPHARAVDVALAEAISTCIGPEALRDDIAVARLRLPARMYGGAIRSLEDVAPAAFLGALCRAAPALIDRRDGGFNLQTGFVPALAAVLGHGAFDADSVARFEGLLGSGTRTGNALRRHWANL